MRDIKPHFLKDIESGGYRNPSFLGGQPDLKKFHKLECTALFVFIIFSYLLGDILSIQAQRDIVFFFYRE